MRIAKPLAARVLGRLAHAADVLGTANPGSAPIMGKMLERTFALPDGDPRYGANTLTPGAAPLEPSFSEMQRGMLRVNLEPGGPDASGIDRRDDATREMRRLVQTFFGREALRWFDARSEGWRGFASGGNLGYGAYFGTTCDPQGLYASKVYYETTPQQIEQLPIDLFGLVSTVLSVMPKLKPLFTTITAQREMGGQRLTFAITDTLKLTDLQPVLDAIGLGRQLPGIMQMLGLALGGRFELPAKSALLAFGQSPDGPDFEVYVLLGMIPDLPANFLSLLTLGLSERPRELTALERWLEAFTPENDVWPGRFSILSVRAGASTPPRISLYLRPVEFEIPAQPARNGAIRPADMAEMAPAN